MGYSLDWLLVRWPVAAVADIVVVGVTLRALAPQPQETPPAALAVQMTLLGAYLASIAVRTLVRGRNVIPFEVVQTAAALVVGLGGALSVTRATGAGASALGMASALIGIACYGVAFAFIERQQHRGRNVYFYTSLAIVLVLVGVTVLLPGAAVTGVLAALAVVSSAGWSRVGRLFLLIHAAVYLVAAAVVSEAVGYDIREVVAGAGPPWPLPSAAMLVVLAASSVTAWLAAREPAGDGSTWARVPRFAIVLVLVLSAGGAVVGYLAPAIGRQPDGAIDAGLMATIRYGCPGDRGAGRRLDRAARQIPRVELARLPAARRHRVQDGGPGLHALASRHAVRGAGALRGGAHHGAADAAPSGLTKRRRRRAGPAGIVQHRPADADDVGAA